MKILLAILLLFTLSAVEVSAFCGHARRAQRRDQRQMERLIRRGAVVVVPIAPAPEQLPAPTKKAAEKK